ncbi:FCD domain-containing protein [Streptomyces sp. NBC_00842]|uniref:FCD domain-containing protein n=1 Tax=unclassified Streptomyces TaxID=2593676 RepID=UPI00386B162C
MGRAASATPYGRGRGFAALDQRFHDAVALASHRPLLADAVERLHSHLHIFRIASVQVSEDPTPAEHERVLRAISRRKADRAAEAMANHLKNSLERQLTQRMDQ